MLPMRSATAPPQRENTTNGKVSAKATMPSQVGELVSSQVSQATPVRYTHREVVEMKKNTQ